jgi:hypothetical protein
LRATPKHKKAIFAGLGKNKKYQVSTLQAPYVARLRAAESSREFTAAGIWAISSGFG